MTKTSRGALQNSRAFFVRKSRREPVRSAAKPQANVKYARARPMIVRKIKCHPYASLAGFGKSIKLARKIRFARNGDVIK